MKYSLRVKPNSKIDLVKKVGDELVVRVKVRAVDGKANEAVVKLLAKYFDVPKTKIRLKSGATSRVKIIEVQTE